MRRIGVPNTAVPQPASSVKVKLVKPSLNVPAPRSVQPKKPSIKDSPDYKTLMSKLKQMV